MEEGNKWSVAIDRTPIKDSTALLSVLSTLLLGLRSWVAELIIH